MQLSEKELIEFQQKILTWYAEHQRDLPWRQTRDPYRILISEVMSQQTQIQRVVLKYTAWLETFPTVQLLASAKVSDVLALWSGLGYNRRALNLKKTAEIVTEKYNGRFPETEKELLALPGIGQYTARALLCFAFDQQVAVVDTNVRKVILTLPDRHREVGLSLSDRGDPHHNLNIWGVAPIRGSLTSHSLAMTDKEIEDIAQRLLPQGKAYAWNQALMDYAGAVLKKERIPIPKQSKFIGSHRYYRGQVVKVLLEKKQVAMDEIGVLIKKEYKDTEYEWLKELLDALVKEGFITIKHEDIRLSS